jgi:hypothetical protein
MADFLTRNRTVLAKIETTPGTDAAPVVGTDAVLVENPRWTPQPDVIRTNEVTGSLDGFGPIFGGAAGSFACDVLLKGAGTAGAAPECGPLLRGCAMSEALAAVVNGTAQAGAAGTITLAAGDAGAANAYRGRLIETTGGTGPGQKRVIITNDATTKVAAVVGNWAVTPDATTTYKIHAAAIYAPASASLENVTLYDYQHNKVSGGNSILRKLTGARANWRLAVGPRQVGRLSLTARGIIPGAPADVAHPGAATYDATRPYPFRGAGAWLGTASIKFNALSIDSGAAVGQPDDPAATFGYDVADMTARAIAGTINPQLVLAATRNIFADLIAGTQRAMAFHWGDTDGNRIQILIPTATFVGNSPDDSGGFAIESVGFEAAGVDDGVRLVFS